MISDRPFQTFQSEEEKLTFLKKYRLASPKASEIKPLYYKGRDVSSPVECDVLGYEREYMDSATLVIHYESKTCFILSLYLKQMQQPNFSVDSLGDDQEDRGQATKAADTSNKPLFETPAKTDNKNPSCGPSYLKKIQNLLDAIILSNELPPQSLCLRSNVSSRGKNAGREISKSICIYEPPFPPGSSSLKDNGRNDVIMNFQEKDGGRTLEFSISNQQFGDIPCPDTATVKTIKSNPSSTYVFFDVDDPSLHDYITSNIYYCLSNYRSGTSFACCSRFEQCSDALKCVHENKLYSKRCKYRANLENGRVFYGRHKNTISEVHVDNPSVSQRQADPSFRLYDFVTLDFETANNYMNSACSVGIAAISGNEIVKKEYALIKPPTDFFSQKNVDIHGITYDMVSSSPPFPDILPLIWHYISNCTYVIAHNARFDMSVLFESAKQYGVQLPDFIYIDSIDFTSVVRECKNSLDACCDYFQIPLENHHNALADSVACANIILAAVARSPYDSLSDYLSGFPGIAKHLYSDLTSIKIMGFSKPSDKKKTAPSPLYAQDDAMIDIPFSDCTYIDILGKRFVLTGVFSLIPKKELISYLVGSGGAVQASVSSKTDFLIVGSDREPAWKHGNYGSKLEKAINLINCGNENLRILKEKNFLDMMNENTK